jgi:RND family efflux transporter MFP subunit
MPALRKTCTALLAACILPGVMQAQEPIPVQVQTVAEVLVDVERNAPADVRSLNEATISAEVAAVVRRVLADVGALVEQGDLLLELDATDYRLAVQQAEANLASSRAQKAQADARLKRAQELGTNQYISADDLLARETEAMVVAAQIQIMEANLAIARRNLEKCEIRAPFDGVIDARTAQLGTYVTPASPLLVLTQSDRFELDAEIPDELAASLQRAHAMQFVSRNESWTVRLLRLSPVVDAERRSRRARFAFVDGAPAIGRSGELVWHADKSLLPANLVVRRNGLLGVFLNRAGRAVFTPLPGAQEGRPVVVDLPPDAEIVVQGRDRLQDGDAIAPSR